MVCPSLSEILKGSIPFPGARNPTAAGYAERALESVLNRCRTGTPNSEVEQADARETPNMVFKPATPSGVFLCSCQRRPFLLGKG